MSDYERDPPATALWYRPHGTAAWVIASETHPRLPMVGISDFSQPLCAFKGFLLLVCGVCPTDPESKDQRHDCVNRTLPDA
jgi:hypothetical protein